MIMLAFEKTIVVFCGVALVILGNSGTFGDDQCNKTVAAEYEPVKTYRSGLERLLEGLGGAVENITGGGGGIIGSSFSRVLDAFEGQVHAIFPGTLWCGPGNVAPNNSYVGTFDRTDKCCRSHDECAVNILPGKTWGNLVNNGLFTRSACGCDHAFYQCLKRANTVLSVGIGNTYFNVLRPQCFTCDYPIVGCAQYDKKQITDKKCFVYELDTNENKTLEWFDNLDF